MSFASGFRKAFAPRRVTLSHVLRMAFGAALFCFPMLLQAWWFPEDSRSALAGLLLLGPAVLALSIALRLRPWMMLIPAAPAMAYAGYMIVFGVDLSYNELAVVLNTNPTELREFLFTPRVAVPSVLAVALLAATAWGLTRKRTWAWTARERSIPFAVPVVVIVTGVAGYLGTHPDWDQWQTWPFKPIYETHRYLEDVHGARRRYAEITYEYHGPKEDELPPRLRLVLIVGESARTANWSLYGYDRETNPRLEEEFARVGRRAALYTDPLSSGRLTMNSVASMLSPLPAEEFEKYCDAPSLVRIFREAGFHTAVVSGQDHDRYWSGPPMLMLSEAHETVSLKDPDSKVMDYDENLLPGLEQCFGSEHQRQLVVVHMSGSHHDYDARYPAEWAHFSGRGRWVDTYDDSLRYSDFVLAEILTRLEKSPTPTLTLFASDHGENLDDFGDGNYMHSCRPYFTCFEFEVPFFTFANPAFAEAFPERAERLFARRELPVSHDNLSQTLLGVAGLREAGTYRPRMDLSGDAFEPTSRFLISTPREVYPESRLQSSPCGKPPAVDTGTRDDP